MEYRSSGSAVAITPHTLLTCAHVVMDAEAITVELPGDDGYTELQATVERLDLEADLAILRVEERLPATVVIGLTRSLALHGGEAVYAQGAALGYSPRGLARGYFASREGDENLLMGACWTARISTAPGSSGGAIFDPRTGFLLGIVRGGLSSGQVCFFIPAPRIVEFIDAWH
ncbi:MAG: serine protease [Planctomycetota bacterium]|nr:serine protease [Planctomycetota bacterium]